MEMNFETHWKDFEDNSVSHSEAHYLLSIYGLKKNFKQIKAIEISKDLGVSRNAVSLQLKRLKAKKLISISSNNINLTKKGQDIIERIASKRATVKTLLSEVLGIPDQIAEMDSCKIEHLLSDQTGEALLRLVKFLRSDKKEVLTFLKAFQKSVVKCDPDTGCGLCENICIMESEKKETLQ